MATVKVIDAICGAGKSTHIMKVMQKRSSERWIYASPYLTEVGDGKVLGRIQKALPDMNFISPESGKGKKQHFKELVSTGGNIAITHNLLMMLDKETLTMIEEGGYNLVIDETLDVVTTYTGVHRDDLRGMVGNYLLQDPTTNMLTWNYNKYSDDYNGTFKEIKDMCELESLYLHKETVLINKLSSQIVKASKSITVLTYLFEGSFMQAWLDIAGIEWEYELLESGIDPATIKQRVRDNLVIESTKKLTNLNYPDDKYLRSAYSSSWYKANNNSLPEIKKGCENYLTKLRKYKIKYNVFWTTFKNYTGTLQGRGFTKPVVISEDGERLSAFVSKNKRASNEYAGCNVCLYLVNVYPHGDISSYLSTQGYNINMDKFALSEMVQFIFRGSIRSGDNMYLVIASERMQELLKAWLKEPF